MDTAQKKLLYEAALIARRRREVFCARVHPQAVIHDEAVCENLANNPDRIVIGEQSHIRGILLVTPQAGQITIGSYSYVGHSTRIWSTSQVTIGNFVLISHLVDIHDSDFHPLDWQARRKDIASIFHGGGFLQHGTVGGGAIVIEDDVWIGLKATILKNIRIGRGAVIAAGSVVTRDVPPFVLVAGNPAKTIKKLDPGSPPLEMIPPV